MRTHHLLMGLLAALQMGCGTSRSATLDGAVNPIDGPSPDAAAVDAMVDASPDARPGSTCKATTEVVLDVAPDVVTSIAAGGGTLYVATATPIPNGSPKGDSILAVDPTTLVASTVEALVGEAYLTERDGWVYVDEYAQAGHVWRVAPGAGIQSLLPVAEWPFPVIADGEYLYWHDAAGTARAKLPDGPREALFPDGVYAMAIDADNLYFTKFDQDVWVVAKTGGTPVQFGYVDYPVVDVVVDGTRVLWQEFGPVLWSMDVPVLPFHAATRFGQMPTLARPGGILVTPDYYYMTDDIVGMQRVPRSGGAFEDVGGFSDRKPVVIGSYLYWANSSSTFVWRCRP
jgi:hypothetical protein